MSENLPHRTPTAQIMQAAEWEGELPMRGREAFPSLDLKFKTYLNQHFIEAPAEFVLDLLLYLRTHEGFEMLTDLTAVDRPAERERFEVVYVLYSFSGNLRIRVKARVALDDTVPSITSIFPAANWLEREIFDMFGIRFAGHPDLKRILMPEDWTGYPLRKELGITEMDNDWVKRNLAIESGQ